jgi:hypothetical protein
MHTSSRRQEASPWCVVGVGHIDSHGRDGQAESEKGESLHGVITEVFMPAV